MTREEEIGTRSGRAGPSFSVRPEKEAKGAVLHGTSAAVKLRHDRTRSAGRTKTRRLTALKQFVRPFFHRARRDEKIPSRATQSDSAGAASASRQRPIAPVTKPIRNHAFCALFSSLRLDRQAESPERINLSGDSFVFQSLAAYLLLIAACAAARRAIGTRNGEQDT